MNQDQLDRFERWFDGYTNRFLGNDDVVGANLQLKQQHTQRVRAESVLLARELALSADETRIAELIALFHDVGRFPQFAEYRTFNDPKSVNHSALGVQILRREGVLEALAPRERQWVETGIGLHGRKALPSALTGRALLFAKIIRDADKIDIFRIVAENYEQFRNDPDNFMLEIDPPDEPRYTPAVLEAVLNGEPLDFTQLRTLTDAKLCHIGWVHDLNFTASLKRIDQCGFLPKLFAFLPADDEIQRVCRKVRDYVDAKLTLAP
ncbi:MAG: HD domain-containing protein [Phycisphaerales bacterium]|nr:MAG: HD domain-containing protein [Phycisphaerales bacterium]